MCPTPKEREREMSKKKKDTIEVGRREAQAMLLIMMALGAAIIGFVMSADIPVSQEGNPLTFTLVLAGAMLLVFPIIIWRAK